MYSHTRRIGSVGRYGVRTGKKVREEIKKIEEAEGRCICPNCAKKIKKSAPGVWECKFCSLKFAGASYLTRTEKKVAEV
jgi:large subunit ribosomal protein L37Ae